MNTPALASDFGVVIPAKPEHLHWARGACASVRRFMGDTPICVLLDGDRAPRDLQRAAGITVITRDEVEPKELRDSCFRSPRAKNAALWASPFETFLLIDADTIVWGDMRELADFDRHDFIVDSPGVEPLSSVMDAEQVVARFPEFDARRHVGSYVNNGVYFGRRGILDLERYLHALRVAREHPGMFYGSQGSFNYVLFAAVDDGSVRLEQRALQVQTGRTPRTDVLRRFAFRGTEPVVTGEPVVLHWVVSPKPKARVQRDDYFEPMTHFRLAFRRGERADGSPGALDLWRLRLEDMACSDFRGSNLRGRFARVRRRSRKRYAALRVQLRRMTPDWLVAALRGNG